MCVYIADIHMGKIMCFSMKPTRQDSESDCLEIDKLNYGKVHLLQ